MRPVLPVGDDQERPGCGQGRDLGVVGLVVRAPVDGHTALADAAAEEMGGDLADRRRDLDPVVDGREQEGLRPAAGAAGHPDALGIDAVQRLDEIDRPHTVPRLEP